MQGAIEAADSVTQACAFCASQRVIPVLIERQRNAIGQPGNPFRRYCRECERWLKMCSRPEWAKHPNARVLPAAFSPENPLFVPAEDTEFADELDEDRAPSNSFRCPACNAVQTGHPEQCGQCEVPYEWSK